MTDGIRSLLRFSWAMSLFGLRQTAELMTALGTARAPRRPAAAFDAVARAAAEQLDERFAGAYQSGERWQGELIEAVFRALAPAVELSRSVASKTLVRGSFLALRQSAAMLEVAMPEGTKVVWQELRNKLEAFESFRDVASVLGFEELPASGLPGQVERAERSDPYLALWLTEGLGFAFAEAAWERAEPDDLLRQGALDGLPSESLIPLHTGMGLSLARQLLPDLDPSDPAADVAAAVERFEELCRRNARDGYALATYEALGLVIRQLAPDAVAEIDRLLVQRGGPEKSSLAEAARRGSFWHGVGRGLYFAASQVLPGSLGRAVDRLRREAPVGLARRNALSGLAWAVTLVNFRQPAVLAAWLEDQPLAEDEAAAAGNGIASALLLWLDAAGQEAHFEAFRGHRPAAGADRWRQLVTEPCDRALAGWPEMRGGPGPGELFYCPAPEPED